MRMYLRHNQMVCVIHYEMRRKPKNALIISEILIFIRGMQWTVSEGLELYGSVAAVLTIQSSEEIFPKCQRFRGIRVQQSNRLFPPKNSLIFSPKLPEI